MKRPERTSGFTIVELLIVIVVIAILAAITIVSYNGIIARADNAKRLAAVDAWTKTLLMYKSQNSSFPTTVGALSSGNYCLGSNFSQTADFPVAGTCVLVTDPGPGWVDFNMGFTEDAALNTQIRSITTIPNTNYPTFAFTAGTTAFKQRGLMYTVAPAGATATLSYFIKDDVDCARGIKTTNRCTVNLE